jgi:transcriptional regulator with XRE-family HTH domain
MGTNAREAGGLLNQALANEIRAERARQRLTQAQVYSEAGLPRSTYVRLEGGDRAIDVEQLNAVARALGVPAAVLVERAEGTIGDGADRVLV